MTKKEEKELISDLINAYKDSRSEFKSILGMINLGYRYDSKDIKKKCSEAESYLTNHINYFKKKYDYKEYGEE